MDLDCRNRHHEYQMLLSQDWKRSSTPLYQLLDKKDDIRAHGLGVQITAGVDVD